MAAAAQLPPGRLSAFSGHSERTATLHADYRDVRALLEAFGWTERKGKGSHSVFTKEGERSITVPTISGRKIKRYIIDQIIERLGLDN